MPPHPLLSPSPAFCAGTSSLSTLRDGAGATLVLGEDGAQAAAGPSWDINAPEEARNTQRSASLRALLSAAAARRGEQAGSRPAGPHEERRVIIFILRHDHEQGTRAEPSLHARPWAGHRLTGSHNSPLGWSVSQRRGKRVTCPGDTHVAARGSTRTGIGVV